MFVLYSLYDMLHFSVFPEKDGQNHQLSGDFYFCAALCNVSWARLCLWSWSCRALQHLHFTQNSWQCRIKKLQKIQSTELEFE